MRLGLAPLAATPSTFSSQLLRHDLLQLASRDLAPFFLPRVQPSLLLLERERTHSGALRHLDVPQILQLAL